MTGILNFAAAFEHSRTALSCGTPTPAITLVVQIEPAPIPTLIPSAPALIKSTVASEVATLPAIISTSNFFLSFLTVSRTPFECPCAVSTTITSTLDFTSSATLCIVSPAIPTAAPTRSLPNSSLHAFGKLFRF